MRHSYSNIRNRFEFQDASVSGCYLAISLFLVGPDEPDIEESPYQTVGAFLLLPSRFGM